MSTDASLPAASTILSSYPALSIGSLYRPGLLTHFSLHISFHLSLFSPSLLFRPELAVDATKKYLDENPDAAAADIAEVVTNQQMASALKSHDKVHIAVQAAITPQFFKEKQVEKTAPTLNEIISDNLIMQRHLIAALEGLTLEKPKNFPVLLKQFYDEDVLEEDTILEWAAEGRNEYTLEVVDEESRAIIRSEAEPVVVWLQEAESDDDDDDDDDDE